MCSAFLPKNGADGSIKLMAMGNVLYFVDVVYDGWFSRGWKAYTIVSGWCFIKHITLARLNHAPQQQNTHSIPQSYHFGSYIAYTTSMCAIILKRHRHFALIFVWHPRAKIHHDMANIYIFIYTFVFRRHRCVFCVCGARCMFLKNYFKRGAQEKKRSQGLADK